VIIGNPPYNIGQLEERAKSTRSKNRPYRFIDANIKATFVARSDARKTAVYDMYSRFFRWSMDRINDNGVIAFITNRSFLDSRSFDGFRKTLAEEFQEMWIVDLGGDVRRNPSLSGTVHNVFGIQTGVAVSFLVRKSGAKNSFSIRYFSRPELETAREKLSFLEAAVLPDIAFETRRPSDDGNWIQDGSSALRESLQTAVAGGADRQTSEQIFARAATGMMTGRDDWIYSRSAADFKKVKFFLDELASYKEPE
jgi:predicted helicase